MRFPFSVVVVGDTVWCATTDAQTVSAGGAPGFSKPVRSVLRLYDGISWRKPSQTPQPTYVNDSTVTTFPAFAVSPLGKELYVAYLKRSYRGRDKNVILVEKFNGIRFEPMGSPLHVFSDTEDGWAYRPAICVDSTGTVFVAWNEHVWGSCAQVYAAHWNGYEWIKDFEEGSSLNHDGTTGAAQSVSIDIFEGKPTVAWSEYTFDGRNFRKIHVKQLKTITQTEISVRSDLRNAIFLRPNPFNPYTEISVRSNKETIIGYSIFALNGRLIQSEKIVPHHSGRMSIPINSSQWAAGIYVVSVTTNHGGYLVKAALVR